MRLLGRACWRDDMRCLGLLLGGLLLVGCGDDDAGQNDNVPEPVEHAGVSAAQTGRVVALSNGVITRDTISESSMRPAPKSAEMGMSVE